MMALQTQVDSIDVTIDDVYQALFPPVASNEST